MFYILRTKRVAAVEISNGRSMAFALFTLCRCPYHNGVSPSGRDCRGSWEGGSTDASPPERDGFRVHNSSGRRP